MAIALPLPMEEYLSWLAVERGRSANVVPGNREFNPGWHTALDLRHLLIVSEAITRSALARRESRGGHFRDDYPEKDPAFGSVNHLARRGASGAMELERAPIPSMPPELESIIREMQT